MFFLRVEDLPCQHRASVPRKESTSCSFISYAAREYLSLTWNSSSLVQSNLSQAKLRLEVFLIPADPLQVGTSSFKRYRRCTFSAVPLRTEHHRFHQSIMHWHHNQRGLCSRTSLFLPLLGVNATLPVLLIRLQSPLPINPPTRGFFQDSLRFLSVSEAILGFPLIYLEFFSLVLWKCNNRPKTFIGKALLDFHRPGLHCLHFSQGARFRISWSEFGLPPAFLHIEAPLVKRSLGRIPG